MNIKEQLDQDLKQAMIAGEADRVTVLRGLKSAILYAEVAVGKKETGLSEQEVVVLLQKEAKKRQESAELYTKGNAADRAAKELAEKTIIEQYLPAQMSEDEIRAAIDEVMAEIDPGDKQQMGKIIGAVKQKTAGAADGAVIARLVREKLQ